MLPAAHGAKEIPSKIKVFAENTGEGFLCKIPPSPLLFKTPRKGAWGGRKKFKRRKEGGEEFPAWLHAGKKKKSFSWKKAG